MSFRWYGLALVGAWSALSAQPSIEAAVEAVSQDVRRYADCHARGDTECIRGFIHWELLDEFGGTARWSQERVLEQFAEAPGPDNPHQKIDYAAPWEPVVSGNRLVTVIPAAYMAASAGSNVWWAADTYLLGVSEDAGATWRFVSGNVVSRRDVERLVPEFRGQLPSMPTFPAIIEPPASVESEYLRTTDAVLVLGEGAASYSLRFRVRKRLADEIALVITFEDPANLSRPRFTQTRLMPGQRTLEIASPMMTGFEVGGIYRVVVHGSDPVTGEELFEHTQPLLYTPDYETEQLLREGAAAESL